MNPAERIIMIKRLKCVSFMNLTIPCFNRLRQGIVRFMNETHFKRFIMIIRSAGFIDSSMIGSRNALNFAYILYLTLRAQSIPDADIELYVRRWFVLSVL